MTGRAKKGGETGKNGEYYKGGQFLPSSENTIKGAQNSEPYLKTGKRPTAPYLWEKQPEVNMISIYERIESCTRVINKSECQYVKGSGLIGAQLEFFGIITHRPIEFDSVSDVPVGFEAYKEKTHKTLKHDEHGTITMTETIILAYDEKSGDFLREEADFDSQIAKFKSELTERWNAGERWFHISEDPFHYLNKG